MVTIEGETWAMVKCRFVPFCGDVGAMFGRAELRVAELVVSEGTEGQTTQLTNARPMGIHQSEFIG